MVKCLLLIFSAVVRLKAHNYFLPGLNDLTSHADPLGIFQQLQTQMDLSLDFFIGVDPGQVQPAI